MMDIACRKAKSYCQAEIRKDVFLQLLITALEDQVKTTLRMLEVAKLDVYNTI